MKILLATSEFDPFRGGIGTYVREMALAASELGHRVTVLAPDYHRDQSALDAGFPFKSVRYGGKTASWSQLPARVRLVRAVAAREAFDIVHAADWPFFLPLALSPFRRKARCIVTFHGSEINWMRHPRRALPVSLCNFWNGWADYVANSHFTAEHLIRKFPQVPREKVRAVPLGVNASWLRGRIDRAEARARLGVADNRFLLVSLGRLTPRKGHGVVRQALAALPPAISSRIDWSIIGSPEDEDHVAALRRTVSESRLNATFHGALGQDDVRLILSAADVFCLPGFRDDQQRFEGFGLVYLEAGALGLPSIATDAGGVPDAVIHGKTGLLVPPNDPDAVASAIRQMFENPDRPAALGQGARAHAEASTWTAVARATYGDRSDDSLRP